jgi:HD-GYP domain-containing protein (c-di-GMP phosphodiesterase class II)
VKIIRLPRSQVHLGWPLPWGVRDAQGQLLLSKGHVVDSEQQLDQLLERGAFVDVEEVRATAQQTAPVEADKPKAPPNLFDLWNKASEQLRTLLQNPLGKPDFVAQLDAFAEHVVSLLDGNVDIGIYRAVRQDNNQHFYYGYTHAIHTAVLCIVMARRLQWPLPRMMSLVKAALTMNLTILELQGQMAAQDVPMKDAQRAEIRAHPEKAVALLTQLGITDSEWLTAIAQHHEHLDGTGYPSGRQDLSETSIALHVADVLTAKISPRAVRESLSPQEAVRQLYREDKGGPISTAIIKEFGIYPPGDYVKLASGEQGLVVQRTANAKAPIVAVVTDRQGHPIVKTIRRDSGLPEFAIVGTVSDKAMLKRLTPERLYGFSMAPGASAQA